MASTVIQATWDTLARGGDSTEVFDPDTLHGLPAPAQRWLTRAVPAGGNLRRTTVLEMRGRMRLGPRWMAFTARQILRAGVGFVWQPVVGGRLVRFTGADVLAPGDARMEFRLHDRIPVVRAGGPDIERSAAGRLAAETVVWLPTAVTPQAGARWTPIDDATAVVAVPTPSGPIEVTCRVDAAGMLRSVHLDRWNGSAKPARLQPFGGELTAEHTTPGGVRIAGAGRVGWDHGTDRWPEGCFFEFELTGAS